MGTSDREHCKRKLRASRGRIRHWSRVCSFGTRWGRYALLFGLSLTVTLPCSLTMAAHSGINYEVAITGAPSGKLRTSLEAISNTVLLRKERPPATLAMLRKRMQQDVPKLIAALKAKGHYAAKVKADMNANVRPVEVTFRVDPGPAYLLKSIDIETTGNELISEMQIPEALNLRPGEPAIARRIIDVQKELLHLLKKQGFPFPRIVKREVVVYHASRSVAVTYRLEPGPLARFGPTKIRGLESVDESVVRNKIPWKEGDRYNIALRQKAQRRLTATALFATGRVSHAETVDEDGLLQMMISVTEQKHRSIGAGVSYKTDEGPGGKISWEHRNLFHHGERSRVSGTVSDFTRAVEGEFLRPGFWRDDQSLRLNLRLAEDSPDAYTSESLRSSILIDRHLTETLTAGGGLAFKTSRVDQLEDTESYDLVSLPLYLEWNTSDDLLDPSRGGRLALRLAPYHDMVRADRAFVKALGTASRYVEVFTTPSLILATRLTIGAITGAERDEIPADERFYAGGGGSIRGYPYQSVGPMEEDEPLGGRSLLELSTEIRWRLTDSFGFVAFLDGGSAFGATGFDSGEDLRWGAGVGIRYFTPVGPLRLDVGIPLNRRPEIDDRFQLYVSLGQAF
jgi:translocation and assembly module TamA